MGKSGCFIIILLTLILGNQPCHAARLKAYVHRFSVSIPENREELKLSMQTLLMSRLNGDDIQAVEKQSDAEIQIEGSYIVFGNLFSLDAVLKTSSGDFIDRVFVQGDTQSELIPSIAELAKSLRRAIFKWNPALTGKPAVDATASAVEKVQTATVKKEVNRASKQGNLPKPQNLPKTQKLTEALWVSHRLPETLNGVATGRTLADKGVEVFITGERYLRYYLKGKNLQFITAVELESEGRIIGVDVADLDQDGVPEVYVTILKGGLPASQVYVPENNLLKKVADNLPYMLRSIALEAKEKKVFAQKIDASGNFTGDVFELIKSGNNFTARNPMQLPLFGNLYNFNKFADTKGKQFFIVAHPDGYLLVYSKDKKQLWKSRDKFGGSEASQCRPEDQSSSAQTACNFSPAQRILVTKAGNVVVSRNFGLSSSGVRRIYSKNSVVQLSWNGASLEEKWRTEQSPNYLADFSCDDGSKELLLLEVEPKDDSTGERGSKLVVKKIE